MEETSPQPTPEASDDSNATEFSISNPDESVKSRTSPTDKGEMKADRATYMTAREILMQFAMFDFEPSYQSRRKPCISSIPQELHIINAKHCISSLRKEMQPAADDIHLR